MRLKQFRVTDYRSINDSGPVDVDDRTALVGRNESGKTNLLLALEAMNPPGGPKPLDEVKDFPRHKRLSDFNPKMTFVRTEWDLTPLEQKRLADVCPSLAEQASVTIGQQYDSKRWVSFPGRAGQSPDVQRAVDGVKTVLRSIRSAAIEDAAHRSSIIDAANALRTHIEAATHDAAAWSQRASEAAVALRKAAKDAGVDLPEKADDELAELEEMFDEVRLEEDRQQSARDLAVGFLPRFIFLDEYPDLNGHQHLEELVKRLDEKKLTASDKNFLKLMKVADLDAKKLKELLAGTDGAERRQLLTNRASAAVTGKLRELWKDRELTVRFALDEHHFDTVISDPTTVYPVEVNLDERSRGFRWFFSFFVTFAADTQGGPAEDAVLLLDEPGLFLHATAQRDLLGLLETDFKDNQTLYTTHSPFMIPEIHAVRTINVSREKGTTVSNQPAGDARTLFPLQAALGYDLAQEMFTGTSVIVEGVTGHWYVSAASDHLASIGRPSLPVEASPIPAGGAQKVSYMVALLGSLNVKQVVLLDSEKKARETASELAKPRLIRDDYIVFVGGAFDPERADADIEDLLDPGVFEDLVRESYAKELEGKTLSRNPDVPRIVKRFELAFEELGIPFHKTRPARLFLRKCAEAPERVLTADACDRFVSLFEQIGDRLARAASDTTPFGYIEPKTEAPAHTEA